MHKWSVALIPNIGRQADGTHEVVSLECLRRANPIRCEGSPIWETLAFSYPIRCELMPLEALTTLAMWRPANPPWRFGSDYNAGRWAAPKTRPMGELCIGDYVKLDTQR